MRNPGAAPRSLLPFNNIIPGVTRSDIQHGLVPIKIGSGASVLGGLALKIPPLAPVCTGLAQGLHPACTSPQAPSVRTKYVCKHYVLRYINSLRANTVSLRFHQGLNALRQCTAEALNIAAVVDILAHAPQTCAKLLQRLLPGFPWPRCLLPASDPGNSCLVQQYFLQIARLYPRIVPIVCPQLVALQSCLEFLRDPWSGIM